MTRQCIWFRQIAQNNHLTLVKDDYGAQIQYQYDCIGNITLEERTIKEGIQHRIRYTYNKNGWTA